MKPPVYVSYATADPLYLSHLEALTKSARRFDLILETVVVKRAMTWVEAAAFKIEILRYYRGLHPEAPLVWVDADARFRHYPALFDELSCDVAAHVRRGGELLSGTLYFAPTQAADRVLSRWSEAQKQDSAEWDQRTLQSVVNHARQAEGLGFAELPPEYCWIFDRMPKEYPGRHAIIEHLQASREMRAAVDLFKQKSA